MSNRPNCRPRDYRFLWLFLAVICVVLLVLSVILAVYSDSGFLVGCVSAAVFGFMTFAFIAAYLSKTVWAIEVYLENKVDGNSTFGYGEGIAKNIDILEEMCYKIGISRLSEYGFLDDLKGEVVQWYDANDLLETVVKLRSKLNTLAKEIEEEEVLKDDLKRWEKRLRQAHNASVRVCLIWRKGQHVTGIEFDRRIGHF